MNNMTNKLDILVVEDTEKHQDSARELLQEYNLRIAETYSQAVKMLGERKPEILLLDMNFPLGTDITTTPDNYSSRPLGYSLALFAARKHIAVPKIAIYTDGNHHSDAISATFDNMYSFKREQDEEPTEHVLNRRPVFTINDSKLVIFDMRDVPRYFILPNGEKGTQRELYDRGISVHDVLEKSCVTDDERKNWKAILDLM